MWLTRGMRESAAGEPALLPRRPEHQPRQASRTTTTPAQKDSGLWRNAFPRFGACTVTSVSPWSAGPWRLGAVPTARPQERSRKAPKPASHQPFKPRWRQSSGRRKPLQPNYSLSIALQENALRVTWLLQMTSGSAAADLRPLAVAPTTEAPLARHTARNRGATLGCPALALEFSRGRRAQPRLQQDLPDAAAKARTGSLIIFSCLRLVCAPICCPMLPPKPGGGEAGLRKKAP